MDSYTASGILTATAATVDHAIAQLWNPSGAKPIYVTQIHYVKFTATGINVLRLAHTTTIGTPAAVITPTIANDDDHELAPVSGAAIQLGAFSVQPTLESALRKQTWILPASIGAGVMWVFAKPQRVKAGTGLAITQGTGVASDAGAFCTFAWEE